LKEYEVHFDQELSVFHGQFRGISDDSIEVAMRADGGDSALVDPSGDLRRREDRVTEEAAAVLTGFDFLAVIGGVLVSAP
jgi:hypothetical protein